MLQERLKKVLAGKRDLHPAEKEAKMKVLQDLKNEMSGEMGNKLDGLKKVSVMSNSPEGLQHGLEKAHDMVAQNSDQYSDEMMSSGGAAYAEGGEVDHEPLESPEDEAREEAIENESPHEEASEGPEQEAHEESQESEPSPADEEFHGLDMKDLEEKIQALMQLRDEMQKRSQQ